MLVSLDGRIDWFVAPDRTEALYSLYYELASGWKEDATLAGADTILSGGNAPEEDERAFEPRKIDLSDMRPILVIPDSQGRVRSWHHLRAYALLEGCCSSLLKIYASGVS